MRKGWWMLLVIVWAASAGAEGLRRDDFAYGVTIDVPTGTAVAAISLPQQVYAHVFRRDLGDLRIFNDAGEPVPHMLRFTRTQPADAPWQPLAFFPLPGEIRPETGGYRVHVRTGPEGAVVRVDPEATADQSPPVRAFLVDLGSGNLDVAQLRLSWRTGAANLMIRLAVATSDDLVHWSTIQPSAAISDIRYAGRRLVNDTIVLARPLKRYLRLHQLDSGPALPLTGIEGRIRPEGRSPVRAFMQISGAAVGDAPGVFIYRTPGAFPVDRINLIFDQANSMAQAEVASRPDDASAWRRRPSGLFYRIDAEHGRFTSAPQPVALTMDSHWRLTVDASESTIGNTVPRLEIGYRPHDLYFIARGRGPFTLAYGSAVVEPLNTDLDTLFAGIGKVYEQGLEQWVQPNTTQLVLGGPQRLQPPPQSLPVRRIVLWSVLIAGVLVVAGMSWRLARRMIHAP